MPRWLDPSKLDSRRVTDLMTRPDFSDGMNRHGMNGHGMNGLGW
jgi:hypothetical protein